MVAYRLALREAHKCTNTASPKSAYCWCSPRLERLLLVSMEQALTANCASPRAPTVWCLGAFVSL